MRPVSRRSARSWPAGSKRRISASQVRALLVVITRVQLLGVFAQAGAHVQSMAYITYSVNYVHDGGGMGCIGAAMACLLGLPLLQVRACALDLPLLVVGALAALVVTAQQEDQTVPVGMKEDPQEDLLRGYLRKIARVGGTVT